MNILHITDLHLDNFTGDVEFLRNGFYEEYIDRLFLSLEKGSYTVDYLIITGDFVHVGKVENFKHIETIVNYILKKFSIDRNKVCLCIGNHDYKWKELTDGDIEHEKLLKSPFNDLRNKYNTTFIEDENNFFLTKLDEYIYFFSSVAL